MIKLIPTDFYKSENIGSYSQKLVKITKLFWTNNTFNSEIFSFDLRFNFTKILPSSLLWISLTTASSFLSLFWPKIFVCLFSLSYHSHSGPLNHSSVLYKMFQLLPLDAKSAMFFFLYVLPIFHLWVLSGYCNSIFDELLVFFICSLYSCEYQL